jgi:hypothetical protein
MNPKDLYETTLDRSTYRLTRITMKDKSKTDEVISGIMGKDSKIRKEMIIGG